MKAVYVRTKNGKQSLVMGDFEIVAPRERSYDNFEKLADFLRTPKTSDELMTEFNLCRRAELYRLLSAARWVGFEIAWRQCSKDYELRS